MTRILLDTKVLLREMPALDLADPFHDRVASSFGALVELVEASGRRARSRTADLMIAAIAHAHGAALLTHNTSDFDGLGGAVSILDAAAR